MRESTRQKNHRSKSSGPQPPSPVQTQPWKRVVRYADCAPPVLLIQHMKRVVDHANYFDTTLGRQLYHTWYIYVSLRLCQF